MVFSGVKPKALSNIIIMVLLFVCVSSSARTSWPIGDTIIIDGEIIYIEERDVYLDVDSLQEECKKDVRESGAPSQYKLSIGAGAGAMLTLAGYNSSNNKFQTLDEFLGNKRSFRAGSSFHIEAGYDFYKSKSIRGAIGVYSGAQISQMQISSQYFEPQDVAPDSQIYLFSSLGGGLWQSYVFPVSIGFESDTTQVKLSKGIASIRVLDIPLKLRYTWYPGQDLRTEKGDWQFYFETGLIYRRTLKSSMTPGILISSDGSYQSVPPANLEPPVFKMKFAFGFGCTYALGVTSSMSLTLNTTLPAYGLSDSDYFFKVFPATLQVTYRRFF
jgi:hypothetical protein